MLLPDAQKGPRAYLPGVLCVMQRLEAVRSSNPLVVVVPDEDAPFFQETFDAWGRDHGGALHSRLSLVGATHFNFSYATKSRHSWADIFAHRWARAGFHILDKVRKRHSNALSAVAPGPRLSSAALAAAQCLRGTVRSGCLDRCRYNGEA